MLLNNLDPEVAERPGGARRLRRLGQGGAQPRGAAGDRPLAARARRRRDAARAERQAGRRSSDDPRGAPRVLIANSLLVPKWATWDEFRRLEAEGLTMFGQMTAGSWIYIGTQGILQGTYQTFAAAAEKHFGARRPGRPHDPHRRARRAWAARSRSRGRWPARRSSASRSTRRGSSGGSRRATSTRRPSRSTTRSPGSAPPRPRGGRCRSGCSGTPPTSCRSSRARGEHFDLVTDQTAAHDPLERLRARAASTSRRPRRCAPPTPTSTCGSRGRRSCAHVEGDARVRPARRVCFRLWQQPAR